MCITGQIPDPATPGVWWRDDTVWRRYKDAHADVIKQGIKSGQTEVILEGLKDEDGEELLGGTYTVDLRIVQQRSPRGFTRPVLIVDGAGAAAGTGDVQVSDLWVLNRMQSRSDGVRLGEPLGSSRKKSARLVREASVEGRVRRVL